MNLIIESGNTSLKLAIFDGDNMISMKRFTHDDTANAQSWYRSFPISRAIFAGSGPTEIELWSLLELEKKRFHRSDIKTITYGYQTPETIGEDRLLNSYFASIQYPNLDSLIIDFGTCITFTLLRQGSILEGGSISPGIRMRLKALHAQTASLPEVEVLRNIDYPRIGKNTEESIQAGVFWGIYDEVEGHIKAYREEFKNLNIIITGGDMLFYQFKLKSEIFADSYWTLRGLNAQINQ